MNIELYPFTEIVGMFQQKEVENELNDDNNNNEAVAGAVNDNNDYNSGK